MYQVVFLIGTNLGTKRQERSPVRKVWRICWTLNLTRWYTLHLETWHLPKMCWRLSCSFKHQTLMREDMWGTCSSKSWTTDGPPQRCSLNYYIITLHGLHWLHITCKYIIWKFDLQVDGHENPKNVLVAVDFCVSGGLLALWKAIPIPGDRRLKPPLPRPRPGSSSGRTYGLWNISENFRIDDNIPYTYCRILCKSTWYPPPPKKGGLKQILWCSVHILCTIY